MPDNLGPPSWNTAERRPHQSGQAKGMKHGNPVAVNVEWMVDTGAELSVVTNSVESNFDLTPVGGSASGTTGGGGIIIKSGMEVEFEVFDPSGNKVSITSNLDVGVKPNNAGSEILGVDQIDHAGAIIEWDPGTLAGRLRQP
ncbi:hypothetical protein [Bradyrhizobium sp.]|uniref:hypothetical protein n=1 Tax=Bradyrhizobium sp. TaxID=376 RepID=UPI004037EC06